MVLRVADSTSEPDHGPGDIGGSSRTRSIERTQMQFNAVLRSGIVATLFSR